MNTMEPLTLEALRKSIEKWRKIVDGTGQDDGAENCALCQMFMTQVNASPKDSCVGCPVKEKTGTGGCVGTPYMNWCLVADVPSSPYKKFPKLAVADYQIEAARDELNFLISLRCCMSRTIK